MKTVRILISSPGDVVEERELARQTIEQLQRRYAGRLRLVPVLWEDLPLQSDVSFQQGIDLVLSADRGIDIAIFVLWARLGSPTGAGIRRPDGSGYRSGTEREFHLMLKAREESGGTRPSILVYVRKDEAGFRERLASAGGVQEIEDMVRQSRLLDQFVREEFHDPVTSANTRAYHSFPEPASFVRRLRVHLIELLDPLLPDQALPEKRWTDSPFRGLEVFDVEHAPIYFGREQAVCDVELALREQARRGCAFVLMVGASGSGKSSLARAGVLAGWAHDQLDAEVHFWRRSALVPAAPDQELFRGLAGALAVEQALPELRTGDQSLPDLAEALAKDPELAVALRLRPAVFQATQGKPGRLRLLLVVDQLEELFTHTDITAEAATRFLKALGALARSGLVWVLGTVRSDFYARCQTFPVLMAMKEGAGQYDLLPPTPSELHRIIQQPVWLAGLRYERPTQPAGGEGLDQVVFNDAIKHPETLPLLEYLLRELYEQRTADGVLTFAAYASLGGVEGALGRRAEALFAGLGRPAQAALPDVLHQLSTVNEAEDTVVVRQRAPLASVTNTPERQELVAALLRDRLCVADRAPDGSAVVQVTHEALLRRWPRAAAWAAENREFLRSRRRLVQAQARWRDEHRSDDYLLRPGKPLVDAEALVATHGPWLSEEVKAYVRRSGETARAHDHRRRLRLRVAVAVFLLLLGAAGIAGWRAHVSQGRVVQALRSESYALSRAQEVWRQAKPIVAAGEEAVQEGTRLQAQAQRLTETTYEALELEEQAITNLAQRLAVETNRVHTNLVVLHELQAGLETNRTVLADLRKRFAVASAQATRVHALHELASTLFKAGTNLANPDARPGPSEILGLVESSRAMLTNISLAIGVDSGSDLTDSEAPVDESGIGRLLSGLVLKAAPARKPEKLLTDSDREERVPADPQRALAEAFWQETLAHEHLTNRVSEMQRLPEEMIRLAAEMDTNWTRLDQTGRLFGQATERLTSVGSALSAVGRNIALARERHSSQQQQLARTRRDFDAAAAAFRETQAWFEEACLQLALFDRAYRRRAKEWSAFEPWTLEATSSRPEWTFRSADWHPGPIYGSQIEPSPPATLAGDEELRALTAAIYQIARHFEKLERVFARVQEDSGELVEQVRQSTTRVNTLSDDARELVAESQRLEEAARTQQSLTDRGLAGITGLGVQMEACLQALRQTTTALTEQTAGLTRCTEHILLVTSVFLKSSSSNYLPSPEGETSPMSLRPVRPSPR